MQNTSKLIIFLITFSFSLLALSSVYAHTEDERIAELRQQIDQLEQEASQYRSNIAGEQAKAGSLKSEIAVLKNQISRIENQIAITSKRIDKTKIEIGGVQNNIFDTQEKIDSRKNTIGRLIMYMDRHDNESLLAILVKNKNLSDFLRQEQYASNISSGLVDLINELKNEKDNLEKDKSSLEGKKQELEVLNKQNSSQKNSLGVVKSSKDDLLKITKGQESEYLKMLADVERRKSLFFTELRELETKTIQGGLYIVHITAQNLPPKGTKLFQWPEDDYRITQGYGMTTHARRGAYGGAPHNGLDIASGIGTPIKAIGDGEIVANGKNDGWGNWVAISHPPYNLVSLYAHMSSLSFLRVGTGVKTGEIIGYEGSTGNSSGSHLHLSIYKEFFTYIKESNGQLYFNYFDGSINPNDYL